MVQTSTGEEEEECVWTHRAKLYRWQDREWKERGIGDAKLLKDKKTEKIRFLLRQEKTCKIMANHYGKKTALSNWLQSYRWIKCVS